MNIQKQKTIIVVALLAFALGSYCAGSSIIKPERPVLRAISTAARLGLKLLVFMEPPPPQEPTYEHRIGDDGFEVINHARSL